MNKLEKFLKYANIFLLQAFALSLMANPFILLFFGGQNAGVYKYTTNEFNTTIQYAAGPSMSDFLPSSAMQGVQTIDESSAQEKQRTSQFYDTIGATALIGWIGVNPELMKKINWLVNKIFRKSI